MGKKNKSKQLKSHCKNRALISRKTCKNLKGCFINSSTNFPQNRNSKKEAIALAHKKKKTSKWKGGNQIRSRTAGTTIVQLEQLVGEKREFPNSRTRTAKGRRKFKFNSVQVQVRVGRRQMVIHAEGTYNLVGW